MDSPQPLAITEKKDRKQQIREAQKRYYDKHKKKSNKTPYDPTKIQAYHKTYYQKNRDKINTRAKEHYIKKKATDGGLKDDENNNL